MAIPQNISDALAALDDAEAATMQAQADADEAAATLRAASDDNAAKTGALNDSRGKQQQALTAAVNLLNTTYGVAPAQLAQRRQRQGQ